MPVRIYEIAKKLGVENKDVLAKAKELGIAGAKVPSSSLDKITAEYLEQQLAAQLSPKKEGETPPEPKAAVPREPVLIKSAPPPAEAPPSIVTASPDSVPAEASQGLPPAAALGVTSPPEPASTAKEVQPALREGQTGQEADSTGAIPGSPPLAESSDALPAPAGDTISGELDTSSSSAPESPEPPSVPEPALPPVPKLGDKVGFIKLPARPGARQGERSDRPGAAPRTPQRPGGGGLRQDSDRVPSSSPPSSRPGEGRVGQPYGRPAFGSQRQGFQGSSRQEPGRPQAPAEPKFVPPATGQLITLKPPIVVRDLAEKLGRKPFQLIADLMELGVFANVNQAVDETVAQRLCAKYNFRFEVERRERGAGVVHAPIRNVEIDVDDREQDMVPRAPIVTIMGHVDHGKTTLLDVIRKSDVVSGEAGGITQHIGAYTIQFPHPEPPHRLQQITFLDTPGHAAFSAMRARGANVTDIVVLVVAANDGVMPQTLEALSHAQAAKVPIIVAVTKCDHPNANAMKVRQQLQDRGLTCEEWGGETIFVDVSAFTKTGIDKLLGMVMLQAEVMDLKANPSRRAKGNIIESGLAQGGPTATMLVRKGTLRVSDVMVCGPFWGKVRALIDADDKRLKEVGPSVAVKILGLNGVPEAGLQFTVVENEKIAREMAEEKSEAARREQEAERRPKVTLENLFDTLATDTNKALKVVIKADTQGSVEAIVEALKKIESTKVAMEVVHSAVGTITESDVLLASASKAIILGFHTRIDNGVSERAKQEGVQIKLYAIIYELVDQVKEAMAGLLDPLIREVTIGSAEVRKIFELSKGGNVAGCVVSSGRLVKGKLRVMRRKSLIFEGVSLSLRRFQDEVNEVRAGMECGIRLDGFNDYQIGDAIECYTLEKIAQKL